jgi:N6-L-threonylcarbamoyladenine synthase
MPILTIESTCDETAAAVIADDGTVLGDCVATQESLHERFRGVVPEVAARAHVQRILPVIDTAIGKAGIKPEQLSAIAVADRPGLAGSLLVGVVAAKTLAVAWNKPLVSVNHLHAHLYACQMASEKSVYPCVGLVVSGGHTSLYRCTGPLDLEYLGGTIDDAAGEAFDKVAAMLQLGFPGGPAVSKLARTGNRAAHAFPRSMLRDENFDFSFSGLKTAVRYAIVGPGHQDFSKVKLPPAVKADLCASFETAVVDVLVTKSQRAVNKFDCRHLIVGGGVAANGYLRERLEAAAREHGFELTIAPIKLCTDNAVMGAIALEKIARGEFASLELDVTPGLQRGF